MKLYTYLEHIFDNFYLFILITLSYYLDFVDPIKGLSYLDFMDPIKGLSYPDEWTSNLHQRCQVLYSS